MSKRQSKEAYKIMMEEKEVRDTERANKIKIDVNYELGQQMFLKVRAL